MELARFVKNMWMIRFLVYLKEEDPYEIDLNNHSIVRMRFLVPSDLENGSITDFQAIRVVKPIPYDVPWHYYLRYAK